MAPVEHTLNELITALDEARGSYHKLALLIGPSNSGKTQILRRVADKLGCSVLNVNLEFSQRMLDVPKSRRPKQADRIFRELIVSRTTDTVLLDNLEILFDPALQLDPLRLLQIVSRNHTIIASWNGEIHEGLLSYAKPDHPEYKAYRDVDAKIVRAGSPTPSN